jgi:hypothetical protein
VTNALQLWINIHRGHDGGCPDREHFEFVAFVWRFAAVEEFNLTRRAIGSLLSAPIKKLRRQHRGPV